MERVNLLKEIFFNKNNLKAIVLGAALTTAAVPFFASCQQPTGGDTIPTKPKTEQPEKEKPGNGGNQNDGNEQDNGGEQKPDNPNGGNENGGNEQGNGGEQNPDDPNGGNQNGGNETIENTWGGEPYDITIGIGNYVLRNFVGDDTRFHNDTVNATNYYLGKAGNYIKGKVNDLNNSLTNRPAAKAYFDNFITKVNNETYFQLDPYYPSNGFDYDVNTIIVNSKSFFADMIENLEKTSQRDTFIDCYRTLANESTKAGTFTSQGAIDAYNNEKERMIDYGKTNNIFIKKGIDIEEEYGNNNFQGITNLMDEYFTTIVDNMNNRRNLNLQVSDFQTIMNIALATSSLKSFDNRVKYHLGHDQHCNMDPILYQVTMERKIDELTNNQNMGL